MDNIDFLLIFIVSLLLPASENGGAYSPSPNIHRCVGLILSVTGASGGVRQGPEVVLATTGQGRAGGATADGPGEGRSHIAHT